MITTIQRLCLLFISLCSFLLIQAQDLRTFNQNASRSNRSLSISFSPAYSSAIGSNKDSLLFRGSGGGFRIGADYFFGNAGIGFSSGFGSSSPANTSINDFLKKTPIPPDQLLITKSNQQNMYLLLGPSVRFGNAVQLYAHAKGGLFVNNGGLINIQQKGAQRAAYRNESTSKSIYPGFQTGLSFLYKGKSDAWSFGIGADYMSTKTEVTNYDVRRGNGIEGLKLSQSINDIIAGVSIRYNIFSPRDHSSGQSTGRRVLPTVNKRETQPRDVASGLSTKTYQPGQPVFGNITGMEENTGSCGQVIQKITNPDGTVEEMTFACAADAANYNNRMVGTNQMPNRISMNVTTPKQTQGATFGEKVSSGLQSGSSKTFAAPHVFESKGIISGTLTWATAGNTGIISNAVITNSSPRGGSTTMNSQTSATRTTNQSSFGTLVRLSARDVSSGQATGKRSSRDAASGLATGRRQYEPIFIEGQGDVCNPCLADAKMSSVNNNPLYHDKGTQGVNPLANNRTTGDDDCDGVAGADIYLIDVQSNSVVAKTKTEQCGDFFFANVPEGNYVVKVVAAFAGKKGYDVYLKSKTDVAGTVSQADDWMQLTVSSSTDDGDMAQKAGISTSRSNIRQKSISIIEADLNGDGEFESLRATGTFSDGTSRDITSDTKRGISNAPGTKGIVLSENAFSMRRRVEVLKSNKQGDPGAKAISSIAVSNNANGLRAIATFSDGSTKDVTEALTANTGSNNVRQYTIMVADADGDGFAESCMKITKSRSNIQNNRLTGDTDDDGAAEAVVKTKTKSNQSNDRLATNNSDDEIWSPRSNTKMIRVATGDVDGDGAPDLVAGNILKDYFQTGDKPTQLRNVGTGALPGGPIVSGAQLRPGSPIGGLSIKGGKNPGGNLRTIQTNENGEFEFNDLDAGDYTFTIEQRLVLDDETPVTVGDRSGVQDHNSSRSNKSSSVTTTDPENNSNSGNKKGDVKLTASQNSQSLRTIKQDSNNNDNENNNPVTKAQNNNTVRSNRTDNALIDLSDNDPADITIDEAGSSRPKGKSNIGPAKWMAPESMKTAINTSRSNIKNQRAALDELEKQLTTDQSNERAAINTSRSNIKNQRAAIDELEETLDNLQTKDRDDAMAELDQRAAVMNTQFLSLQASLKKLGQQYTAISNVLKTKHDIAMNSIRNMK